jgi:cytochrome c oxidase cbb3-type subunit 3
MSTMTNEPGGSGHGGAGRTPRDHLLDHEYDGIREYDNPTPGWWHIIFLASVIFSVFYFAFWQFSPMAYTPQEAWTTRQNVETKKLFAGIGEISPDVAGMRKLMGDEKLMSYASGVFQMNCAQCHAKDGGGINGVNLTDNVYKNVKVMPDIITVITAGANNGAMPAWRNNFSEKERVLIAAYVANLRGTTPARGREPEGVEIPAWPE